MKRPRLGHKSSRPADRRQRPLSDLQPASSRYAYRANRAEQQVTAGQKNHVVRFILQRFGLIILLLALVVSLVNGLSLSTEPRVMPLTTSDNLLLHSPTVYQSATRQLLASSILNRNKITVNTAHIDQQLLAQFPELSSASLTIPLFSKRPILYVQTLQPALILNAQDGSFVLDSSGKALLLAGNLPSTIRLSLPLVTDQSGLRVSLNHQVLTAGDVSFIQVIVAQLAARHFTVSSMVLPSAASELDVRLNGLPYMVKFNLESGDARQQVGTFLATQAQLKSQNVTPSQYIDVRVDGRAYYQ